MTANRLLKALASRAVAGGKASTACWAASTLAFAVSKVALFLGSFIARFAVSTRFLAAARVLRLVAAADCSSALASCFLRSSLPRFLSVVACFNAACASSSSFTTAPLGAIGKGSGFCRARISARSPSSVETSSRRFLILVAVAAGVLYAPGTGAGAASAPSSRKSVNTLRSSGHASPNRSSA